MILCSSQLSQTSIDLVQLALIPIDVCAHSIEHLTLLIDLCAEVLVLHFQALNDSMNLINVIILGFKQGFLLLEDLCPTQFSRFLVFTILPSGS